MFKILEKLNSRDILYMDINTVEQFPILIFLISKKKLLSVYTETTLNGDFNPKSAIISINTNTKKKICWIPNNYIIRDGLSQKTISRYCPFNCIENITENSIEVIILWAYNIKLTRGKTVRKGWC
jgi:hypothetical protein